MNLLKSLADSENIHFDGTFDVVKESGVSQLFTILIKRKNDTNGVPVAFALLQNKEQSTYDHLFAEIKKLAPGL